MFYQFTDCQNKIILICCFLNASKVKADMRKHFGGNMTLLLTDTHTYTHVGLRLQGHATVAVEVFSDLNPTTFLYFITILLVLSTV